jgi:hypothetical protein
MVEGILEDSAVDKGIQEDSAVDKLKGRKTYNGLEKYN